MQKFINANFKHKHFNVLLSKTNKLKQNKITKKLP